MNRIGIVVAVCIFAALVAFAWMHQRTMTDGLPPRTVCSSQADALAQAGAFAKAHGGDIVPVLGTGSMSPYLPAAPAGVDPLGYVGAYVIVDRSASYESITLGQLCVYRAEWSPRYAVMHQAAQRDSLGLIMSGLNNPRSESHWRVTPKDLLGVAVHAFVWPVP